MISIYDSLAGVISWQPNAQERGYLHGYAAPLIRRYFNHDGQLLVVGPHHNQRWQWHSEVFDDKRLLKALLHSEVTAAVYAVGDTFGTSKPTRIPLKPIGSTAEVVIEPEAPEEPWFPKEPLSAMRPARPSVDHNLANSNGRAILGRIEAGHIVSVGRANTGVILFRWGPQNPPPLGHVIAVLLEHHDAFALELNMRTMREAPVPGFVVAK
jgi:hypothetical protein